MANSVNTVIQSCAGLLFKGSSQPPARKLMLLLISDRLWSHIAVDFVTNLPVSQGNTVKIVVVDCFSKGCRLIPYSSLPYSLFHHVSLL